MGWPSTPIAAAMRVTDGEAVAGAAGGKGRDDINRLRRALSRMPWIKQAEKPRDAMEALAQALVMPIRWARTGLPPIDRIASPARPSGRKRAPGAGRKHNDHLAILAIEVQRAMCQAGFRSGASRDRDGTMSPCLQVVGLCWATARGEAWNAIGKHDYRRLFAPGRRFYFLTARAATRIERQRFGLIK